MRNRLWNPLCVAGLAVIVACAGDGKPVAPAAAPNLRLQQVVFTQVVQDSAGSLPLVAGAVASAKVLVVSNRESVVEVPVVLRLFRGSALVYTDTALTSGVLGRGATLDYASAEFFVPGRLVSADVSWQVALDPRELLPDSTRGDNLLPATTPTPLQVVVLPPVSIRVVPVILTRHDSVTGDVTPTSVGAYLRLAKQVFPASAFTVTVGGPVYSAAEFGAPPEGGDRGFWTTVLADVDRARIASSAASEFWYGVVTLPRGYLRPVYGGYGYIPPDAAGTGLFTRSAAGLGLGGVIDAQFAQQTLAHELGHNFGRLHAPGCGVTASVDTLYPNQAGTMAGIGHDVWAWATGESRGAQSVGAATADLMSYCTPRWIGPYTHAAVTQWRAASGTATRTVGGGVAVP